MAMKYDKAKRISLALNKNQFFLIVVANLKANGKTITANYVLSISINCNYD